MNQEVKRTRLEETLEYSSLVTGIVLDTSSAGKYYEIGRELQSHIEKLLEHNIDETSIRSTISWSWGVSGQTESDDVLIISTAVSNKP